MGDNGSCREDVTGSHRIVECPAADVLGDACEVDDLNKLIL
jgi:hypothetical protein